jgi:hypothetical protein
MDALRQARDTAELRFHDAGFDFHSFHDLCALNRILNEPDRTATAFKIADRTDPGAASRLYHVAESVLIRRQEYALCGKYLDPEKQLGSAVYRYQINTKLELEFAESRPELPKTATMWFVQEAATLIALLVKNGRPEDASWVARTALAQLDDQSFRPAFDAAHEGNIPTSR